MSTAMGGGTLQTVPPSADEAGRRRERVRLPLGLLPPDRPGASEKEWGGIVCETMPPRMASLMRRPTVSTLPPIDDDFTPADEDWAEFLAWADAELHPEPTPADCARADGYIAGPAGGHDGPIGREDALRAAWWDGFMAGFAAASEACTDALRAIDFLPADVVDRITAGGPG